MSVFTILMCIGITLIIILLSALISKIVGVEFLIATQELHKKGSKRGGNRYG